MKTAPSLLLSAGCAALAATAALGYLQSASATDRDENFKSEYDFKSESASARAGLDPARVRRTGAMLCEYMRMAHFLHRPFDKDMAPLAWTNFLDSFDPQRIYFTAEDLAEFESGRTGYAELLAAGDTA